MKRLLSLLLLCSLMSACDDPINVTLTDSPSVIAIDAWVNNGNGRTIRVQRTQPYFDNSTLVGITDARVVIEDDRGDALPFTHTENGSYAPAGSPDTPFGEIGRTYTLTVDVGNVTFTAVSTMNRVPQIDSVTFRFEEKNAFWPDSYFGEFWARDFQGEGDTYWIKSWKNGQYLNKPSEINIAYDASFSAGGLDGLIFIQPIRDAVNPFEEADDDADELFIAPFQLGDSIYVEIESVTNEAHFFLVQVAEQTDRGGGFEELFATPLSNVSTNIRSSDPDVQVVGFFNVGAVSGLGRRLTDESDVRVETE